MYCMSSVGCLRERVLSYIVEHTHARTHARTHERTHARTHAHTHTHTNYLLLLQIIPFGPHKPIIFKKNQSKAEYIQSPFEGVMATRPELAVCRCVRACVSVFFVCVCAVRVTVYEGRVMHACVMRACLWLNTRITRTYFIDPF